MVEIQYLPLLRQALGRARYKLKIQILFLSYQKRWSIQYAFRVSVIKFIEFQATTIISKSSNSPPTRTVSPSQLQEEIPSHGNEDKTNYFSGNTAKQISQENNKATLPNASSSESSPPTTKTRKNETKHQVYHELTQQTLRLEKPKVLS